MENNKLSTKIASFSFIISFFSCIIATIIFYVICTIVLNIINANSTLEEFSNTTYGTLLSTIVFDLTMLIIFFSLNKGKNNKIISKPKTNKAFLYILISIATFFCLSPIINCFDKLFSFLGFKSDPLQSIDLKSYLISIISLVLLPAICEELLFRGLIFKGLKQNGKAFSIMLSSIMFSIFHMSIYQTIYPLLVGMLLGVIMYYENNILYTIIVHAINNFLSLTFQYLNISLVFEHWSYILLAILLLILFLCIIIKFIIKDEKSTHIKLNFEDKLYLYISLIIMIIINIVINIGELIINF